MYLKNGNQFCILDNKELRTSLLYEHHDIKISSHLRRKKIYELLVRNYY